MPNSTKPDINQLETIQASIRSKGSQCFLFTEFIYTAHPKKQLSLAKKNLFFFFFLEGGIWTASEILFCF